MVVMLLRLLVGAVAEKLSVGTDCDYSNPKLVVRVEQTSSLSGQDAQLTNQIGLLYQVNQSEPLLRLDLAVNRIKLDLSVVSLQCTLI